MSLATHLEILRSNSAHVGNSEDETYRVENIGLSTAVQAGNRIEALVPCALSARVSLYGFVVIVYHPEMTVRTAYDLKPCQRRQQLCQMQFQRLNTHL